MMVIITDGDDGLTCGHGDHEEVDAVPVGQALAVGEARRVAGVFQLVKDKD